MNGLIIRERAKLTIILGLDFIRLFFLMCILIFDPFSAGVMQKFKICQVGRV